MARGPDAGPRDAERLDLSQARASLSALPGDDALGVAGALHLAHFDADLHALLAAARHRSGEHLAERLAQRLAGLAGNGERDSSGSTSDATAGLRLRGSDQPGGRENPRVDGADQRVSQACRWPLAGVYR